MELEDNHYVNRIIFRIFKIKFENTSVGTIADIFIQVKLHLNPFVGRKLSIA